MDEEEALTALRRQAVLWQAGETSLEPVVRAACDALVAGCDGEHLRALAGESLRSDTRGTLDALLVPSALAEQGRPVPARGTDAAILAALPELAADVLAGRRSPRDLVKWAHESIGHGGPAGLGPLVSADDEYEVLAGCDGPGDVPLVDARVRRWCQQLTADPGSVGTVRLAEASTRGSSASTAGDPPLLSPIRRFLGRRRRSG